METDCYLHFELEKESWCLWDQRDLSNIGAHWTKLKARETKERLTYPASSGDKTGIDSNK